jgi:hypothetical protein
MLSSLVIIAAALAAAVSAQDSAPLSINYEAFADTSVPCTISQETGTVLPDTCTNVDGHSFRFISPNDKSCHVLFFNQPGCVGSSYEIASLGPRTCGVPTFPTTLQFPPQPKHHAKSVIVSC